MRAVNLLPSSHAESTSRLPPLPVLVGGIGGIVVLAFVALTFMSASGKLATQKTALAAANAAYEAVPEPIAPPAAVSAIPAERQARVSALSEVLGQRVSWDRVLREVSQVIPSDVSLQTLTAQAPALSPASAVPTPGITPTGFTITGCTYSQAAVAVLLARLQLVPDLSQMTLVSSSTGGGGGSGATAACAPTMTSFSLAGNVLASGAAS